MAVAINAPLISAGDQDGCASATNAAIPAVCGLAIDVPDRTIAAVPLPTEAETTATPGAAMSGLSALSERGPFDENDAKRSYPGLVTGAAAPSVTEVPLVRKLAAWASSGLTPTNGIVTPAMGPSTGGK
ncbi:unannotated protein [freshwater metagenome]|uniref:Unannotated protein n=1 Tax=freshwater metagenome TaxID=449393 RepID=A0A6J7ARG9_9ZZZZ